jgi:DtxR family Mn-dependent transcriptional regulator
VEYNKLSECQSGDTVTLAAVIYSSDEFLKFLNNRGLQLGVVLKIISMEPFDGTMTVSYGKRKSEMLSRVACDRLLIKKV